MFNVLKKEVVYPTVSGTRSVSIGRILVFLGFLVWVLLYSLAEKPYREYSTWFVICVLFIWSCWLAHKLFKLRQKMAGDEVVYNLFIKLTCHERSFRDTGLRKAEDDIEMYGLAINKARRMLCGNWMVTKSGRLIRGLEANLKTVTADIEIDHNIGGLTVLEKIRSGNFIRKKTSCAVHMHLEGGAVVGVDFIDGAFCLN